jgi:hypothetical protein
VIGWMLRQIAFWIVREAHVEHPAEVSVAHGEH